MRRVRYIALLPLLASLGACQAVVLHPAGEVAVRQRNLLVEATALMLIVIVPVMAATVFFAWRYRASNTRARYQPDWDHSMHLELVIWSVPLLIIICLGALTWLGAHLLDPYRPLAAAPQPSATASPAAMPMAARMTLPASSSAGPATSSTQPLQVDVVALDWKWLFIYPQYDIATVNELAAPIDRPIDFRITASSVMNSFYIPALAGQIYAMPGMQTQLHAVLNRPGDYTGISANYSGAGFSDMHFVFHGLADPGAFARWIADVRQAGGTLSRDTYLQLVKPSEDEPVHRYAAVAPDLFQATLGMCVAPGKRCANGMDGESGMADMSMDGGAANSANAARTPAAPEHAASEHAASEHAAPLLGAGLTPPDFWSLQPPEDHGRTRPVRRPSGS